MGEIEFKTEKTKWLWISYPLPEFLQTEFIWNLWKKFMCIRGYHLWDEVYSNKHYLFCDACEIRLEILEIRG